MGGGRLIAGLASAAVVCASVLVGGSAPRANGDVAAMTQVAAATEESAPVKASLADAVSAAVVSGSRVDIASMTSETVRGWANPDGTVTSEFSAGPVRVRQGSGWVAANPSLVRLNDGSWAAKASPVGLVVSGGGSGPLIQVSRRGVGASWSWPWGVLPAPQVSGDTATYPEVLPGVDLRVRSSVGGVSEVLVVKDAKAARLPALASLTFPVTVTGGSLVARGAGMEVRSSAGESVFVTPAPAMWDSSRGLADVVGLVSTGGGVDSPREGAQISPMGMVVKSGGSAATVTVVPDQGLLTSPTATFPIMIDPTTTFAATAWTMVSPQFQTPQLNWTGDTDYSPPSEGMGYWQGTKKRLLWAYNLSALPAGVVVNAQFSALETHASSCEPTHVQLIQTQAFPTTVTWVNQPADIRVVDSKKVSYGRVGCATKEGVSAADTLIEFDVKSVVASLGANRNVYFKLQAANESDNSGWKRFTKDATLVVTVNVPPPPPTGVSVIYGGTSGCVTGAARPSVQSRQVDVVATGVDPEGGPVTVTFQGFRTGTSTAVTNPLPVMVPSNGQARVHLSGFPGDEGLPDSSDVSVKITVTDDQGQVSTPNKWCEFHVEIPPATPVLAAPAEFFPVTTPAIITITTPLNGKPATSYQWWSSVDPTAVSSLPGSATHVSVTVAQGFQEITVRALSAVPTVFADSTIRVFGQTPAVAGARWAFDETSGALAAAAEAGSMVGGSTAPELTLPTGAAGVMAGDMSASTTDWAVRLTSGSGPSVASPGRVFPVATGGVSIGMKVPDGGVTPGSRAGVLVSEDGPVGQAPVFTMALTATGSYQASVRATSGVFSAIAPAGTVAGGWDAVAVAYLPPTATTAGWIRVWVKINPNGGFVPSPVTVIPAGTVMVEAPPSAAMRVGASRSETGAITRDPVGALDDLSVWGGYVATTHATVVALVG